MPICWHNEWRIEMHNFTSLAELHQWLHTHHIDITTWGCNGTKTVEHLWVELQRGESELFDNPPRRVVRVAELWIRRDDQLLFEVAQTLDDRSVRSALRPPSEKLLRGESPLQATLRCLHEELEMAPSSALAFPEPIACWVCEMDSRSYPGLPAYYTFYRMPVEAPLLGSGPFTTAESSYHPGEPVRRHHWAWRPVSDYRPCGHVTSSSDLRRDYMITINIRPLPNADFARLTEIDLSEHITQVYRMVDGQLEAEVHDWHRPRGDEAFWREHIAEWRQTLKPDLWLGAYDGERLAGLASLRYELAPGLAQLTTLHVSQPYRRRGVARQLVQTVADLARQHGAQALYVSAIPSQSAVNFYLSQGFRPTSEPNPAMFALEPEDIHMVRTLTDTA